MSGHTVGYIRVSTLDQSTERQLDGVTLDRIFEDKVSGKDTARPQLQQMLRYVRDGDTLIVHSLDRLARNLEDLLVIVRDLTGRGVTVRFVKENLTFSGEDRPLDTLMLQLLGAFAQFERSLIRERQREGIELAKRAGRYHGRGVSLTPGQIQDAAARKASGVPHAKVARELGVSRQTLYTHLRGTE